MRVKFPYASKPSIPYFQRIAPRNVLTEIKNAPSLLSGLIITSPPERVEMKLF
jgi:hypothetical protein